ncbi:MAG: hypothetical protein ISR69_11560, partial [Gammaproteobacteria bacterium]|nr:hypothetical protein [Gammaproteobacteria bacterium]
LHSSIVALVSLASGIASNHPAMGQCQIAKLRHMGISEDQIATVIEIARHIRDEAAQKMDLAFSIASHPEGAENLMTEEQEDENCCSTTASGKPCC